MSSVTLIFDVMRHNVGPKRVSEATIFGRLVQRLSVVDLRANIQCPLSVHELFFVVSVHAPIHRHDVLFPLPPRTSITHAIMYRLAHMSGPLSSEIQNIPQR